MSALPPLYVRLQGEVRGPFGAERLAELAQAEVVTPATDAAPAADGPWAPLGGREDCAALFPARPAVRFRAKDFTPVNRPAGAPVDVADWFATARGPDAPRTPPEAPAVSADLRAILEVNRARERAAGLDHLPPPPPRPNRRRRDYCLIVIGGNLVILLGVGWLAGFRLAVVMATVFTVFVTWAMFGVMDRY